MGPGLVPVNVTVRTSDGRIGRVSGHVIRDLVPLNVVDVPTDIGSDHLELRSEDLEEQVYLKDVWRKNLWTLPDG